MNLTLDLTEASIFLFLFFRLLKDVKLTFREKIEQYIKEQKIGQHLTDNKDFYVGVGITGIVILTAFRGRTDVRDGSTNVNIRSLNFFSRQTVNVITVVKREGRGHPGYPTKCVETGEKWFSQTDAARAKGIDPVLLSMQLRGLRDHVNGLHFEHFEI